MGAEYLPTGPINFNSLAFESVEKQNQEKKIVALGGGHGLYGSLKALRLLTNDLTAVVTVADDGGSSGRIRQQRSDLLPPGDLRMALAALCDDDAWGKTWRDVMQYRFKTNGDLNEHNLGNLLIVALWDLLQDPVEGLQWAARLLEAKGTVLPMTLDPLHIEGDLIQGERKVTVFGQHNLAIAEGQICDVRLEPHDARIPEQVFKALHEADFIVAGPGSLYTSVLPHFLLPEMRHILKNSKAKLCFTLNISVEDEETGGMKAVDHLKVLEKFSHGLRFDYIIVNEDSIDDVSSFEHQATLIGAQVIYGKLAHSNHPEVHDPLKLATIYQEIFTTKN